MLKKTLLIGATIIFLIIFSILFVVIMGHRELNRQRQAWLDAGGTLDAASIAPSPPPDAMNAAVAYQPIFVALDGLPPEEKELLGVGPDENPDVVALVEKCQPIIAQLHTATQMEKCCWVADYSAGLDTLLPHLGRIRNAARILQSDAKVAAANGDDERAVRDLEAIARLSIQTAEEPTLIGQLVALAVQSLATGTYEEMFRDRPAPVNAIVDILAAVDTRARLRASTKAEVVMMSISADQLAKGGSSFGRVPPFAQFVLSWDHAYYYGAMSEAITRLEKPYYEAHLNELNPPWYAFTTKLLAPALTRSEQAMALGQVQIEMLIAAEQLRSYKAEHGEYPEPGGDFEIPIDPATGKPFEYERVGEGFVLTSGIEGGGEGMNEWRWTR